MITTHAFELKIGAAARNAQRCTEKYIEDVSQLVSRFEAKNLYGKSRLCRILQKGGA